MSDPDRNTGEWPQTWLVVDWPEGDTAPYHHHVAWFKIKPTPQRCLRLSRGRFAIEQFFQRDKAEPGARSLGRSLVTEISPSSRAGGCRRPESEKPDRVWLWGLGVGSISRTSLGLFGSLPHQPNESGGGPEKGGQQRCGVWGFGGVPIGIRH